MEEDFDTIVREMTEERHRNEYYEDLKNANNGEHEYTMFKCWCWAFKNGEGQTDAKVFAEYLKSENKELDFWAKKHLAETYFGYEYEYSYEKLDWIIRKKKDILEKIDEKDEKLYDLNN